MASTTSDAFDYSRYKIKKKAVARLKPASSLQQSNEPQSLQTSGLDKLSPDPLSPPVLHNLSKEGNERVEELQNLTQ